MTQLSSPAHFQQWHESVETHEEKKINTAILFFSTCQEKEAPIFVFVLCTRTIKNKQVIKK